MRKNLRCVSLLPLAFFIFLNSILLSSAACIRCKPLKICDLLIRNKCENDFKRISEFFTGYEDPGGRAILRTDPCNRNGVYFILDLNKPGRCVPEGTRFVLDYVGCSTERPDLQRAEWVLTTEGRGQHFSEFFLGLTDARWSCLEGAQAFLAWKLSIFSPDGELLACRQSFMWQEADAQRLVEKKKPSQAVDTASTTLPKEASLDLTPETPMALNKTVAPPLSTAVKLPNLSAPLPEEACESCDSDDVTEIRPE